MKCGFERSDRDDLPNVAERGMIAFAETAPPDEDGWIMVADNVIQKKASLRECGV